jgi:hypothetical protein
MTLAELVGQKVTIYKGQMYMYGVTLKQGEDARSYGASFSGNGSHAEVYLSEQSIDEIYGETSGGVTIWSISLKS